MRKVLGILGKIGKGAATILGGTLGVGGIALGGGDRVAGCLKDLASSPDTATLITGLVVLLFGIARKAGWVAREQASNG